MNSTKKTTPVDAEVVGTKDTAIVAQESSIVNFNVESLMAKAIEHGLSPETMEKFLAMRQQLKAEWAKEQFTKAMAAFQAECPTIQKTKEVKTKSGIVAYRYAPIESIVDQVKVHLQKNGFSYSSNMELIENGTTKVKATIKVTHQDGHSEVTEMTVPLGNKTDIMSQSQVVAAAQTFAKRYAFCNAFGILTGDEDTDARPVDMPKEEIGQPIQQTFTPRKPTEKQAKLIKDLCVQKNIGQTEILEMAKGKTPSQLIDLLFQHPTNPKPEPVIDAKTGELSPEDKALVDEIPF